MARLSRILRAGRHQSRVERESQLSAGLVAKRVSTAPGWFALIGLVVGALLVLFIMWIGHGIVSQQPHDDDTSTYYLYDSPCYWGYETYGLDGKPVWTFCRP